METSTAAASRSNGAARLFWQRTGAWQRFLVRCSQRIERALQRMPPETAHRWGERIGRAAYLFAASQRRYADRNLRLAGMPTPQATAAERDALIRRVFISFGKSIIDFLRGPGITPETLDKLVLAEGLEYAKQALERGKGAILVTAHLGNWELLGRYLAQHGVPLTVVARDPDDPDFGNYVRGLRQQAGIGVAAKGGPVRELLSLLKRNQALGLLPDQNSGDLFVPFFGIPAGTVAGPAALALHNQAPILPTYCVRLPDNRYRLMVLPPIDTHATGDRQADQHRIMADVNRLLESIIREYPDQWLWLHNRWKSSFEDKNRERAWPGEAGKALYNQALRLWNGESG